MLGRERRPWDRERAASFFSNCKAGGGGGWGVGGVKYLEHHLCTKQPVPS